MELPRLRKSYPRWLALLMLSPFILGAVLGSAYNALTILSLASFGITYFYMHWYKSFLTCIAPDADGSDRQA